MSTTNVKSFFEAVNSDKELAEKLAAADKAFGEKHVGEEKNEAYRLAATQEIIIPVAKEAGFNINVDDIVAFEKDRLENMEEEFSDEELTQVAGGFIGACTVDSVTCHLFGHGTETDAGCYCFGFGFDRNDSTCILSGINFSGIN